MDSLGEDQNVDPITTRARKTSECHRFAHFYDFARYTRANALRITVCVRISPREQEDSHRGRRNPGLFLTRSLDAQLPNPDKGDKRRNYRAKLIKVRKSDDSGQFWQKWSFSMAESWCSGPLPSARFRQIPSDSVFRAR